MSARALAVLLALLAAFAGEAVADESALARVEDATPTGPGLDERLAEIRERIQRALVYPPLARLRDADGEATVRFEIGADGRAHDVRVVRSSGDARLDGAAERAVVRAGVLPRVYGPLEVPVRFELRDGESDPSSTAPR